jgi:hypothetical protein
MRLTTDPIVQDARPPDAVVQVMNMIIRPLLHTPAATLIKPLALLEFHGRRSGQQRRVVVAWHVTGDAAFVITPARWRTNFVGGHPATVHHRGRSTTLLGTLHTDRYTVAEAINRLLHKGTSPRSLALQLPDGHVLDGDDIVATDRALICFRAIA